MNKIFLKQCKFICFAVLFCSFFAGYAQENVKDSVWLTIESSKEITYLNTKAVIDYQKLFKKPIQVPVITEIKSGDQVQLIASNLKDVLKQFRLNDSYTESELRGTSLEKSLKEVTYISFPFSNLLTSSIASSLAISNNHPKLIAYKDSLQELSIINDQVVATENMIQQLQRDYSVNFNHSVYIRKRLLDFIVGNYNQESSNLKWLIANNTITPYLNSYQNQFMKFEGTHKLLSKLLPAYKHFETYDKNIRNIKKVSRKLIGFDVNMLSSVPYNIWEEEVQFIQKELTEEKINDIKLSLPIGISSSELDELLEILKYRIQNLNAIANKYYNLLHQNKIVHATNVKDVIHVIRKEKSTIIQINDAAATHNEKQRNYEFLNADTKQIWIYALNGNDYFEESGACNSCIPIALIGGKGGDKFVFDNGKNTTIYDDKEQTFLIETKKAKVKLAANDRFTKTIVNKYKHVSNRIKPIIGANPDDGIFIGLSDEILIQNFNRKPFSQKHEIATVFNLGNFGFNVNYYGEIATFSNHFNAFVNLSYQSPNYATNFFGFGNETPNFDANLKLDYNRVRMSNATAKLGILKENKIYLAKTNLFFESREIQATEDRFITSETLFLPTDDFFERKNYGGLSIYYSYKDISISFLPELKVEPTILAKYTANLSDFNISFTTLNPNLKITHPIFEDAIVFDASLDYATVIGDNVPFYQAVNIGGNNGLRGFRNQRFTGKSALYTSTNIKWSIKDLESDVLPLQIGVLGGFDAGRIWIKDDESDKIHTSVGAGVWLQTANLLRAQLQVFGFDEGMRLSFKLTIGL